MSTCSIMPKCLICMLYVWLLERQLLKHIKKTLATMNVCFHQVFFFMFVLTLFILLLMSVLKAHKSLCYGVKFIPTINKINLNIRILIPIENW